MNSLISGLIVCGICLVAIGCRTPDPTVELLESELRWMEDQLYQLDDQLETCCDELASARRSNDTLRRQLAASQKGAADSTAGTSQDGRNRRDQSSGSARAGSTNRADDEPFDEELDTVPPVIERGGSSPPPRGRDEPRATSPPQLDRRGDDTNAGDNAGGKDQDKPAAPEDFGPPIIEFDESPLTPQPLPAPEKDSRDPFQDDTARRERRQVSRLRLNRQLTGGYDFDGQPGDEGLLVVAQPQDIAGNYVPVAGPIRVMLVDPQQQGAACQVAVWDFDEVDARRLLKESLLGKGFHIQLPWPGRPPEHEQLQVDVIYQTVDGRLLRTAQEIRIQLPETPLARPASYVTPPRDETGGRAGRVRLTGGEIPSGDTAPGAVPPRWSPRR